MTGPDADSLTVLLRAAGEGDGRALDRVFATLYDELRGLAHGVRGGSASETLVTTALVHEAYVKLMPALSTPLDDRVHFFSLAARAMRQVLVDAARRKGARKRGGDRVRVSLDDELDLPSEAGGVDLDEVLTLDALLSRLERWNARQAEVVQCRVFAGLSGPETARALGVSERTVKRDWRLARAWLIAELTPDR